MVRPQVTAYLDRAQKQWLADYSNALGIRQSELVRILVERERQVRWLNTVLRGPQIEVEKKLASAVINCLKKGGD